MIERHSDKALCAEIENLGGACLLQQPDRPRQIRQIVLDKMKIGLSEDSQFFHPPEVDRAGPAVSSVDLVTLREEQFSQIRAVLSGNSGDDCRLHTS